MNKSKSHPDKILVYRKTKEDEELQEDKKFEAYVYKGGVLSFYGNKVVEIDGELTPSALLTDFWSDLSWAGIAKEGGVRLKNGKKPEKLIKRIIEMTLDDNEIVLDFFLGSGTTTAVAHKMGYQYIGIEQLEYGENDSRARLENVVMEDKSGISNIVNWKGGGDFINCELMQFNDAFLEKIQEAESSDQILQIWKDITISSFLNWYVNPEMPEDAMTDFISLGEEENGLEKQKRLLAEMLDKNQLYVNLSEMDDAQFDVSEKDKALNRAFYKEV